MAPGYVDIGIPRVLGEAFFFAEEVGIPFHGYVDSSTGAFRCGSDSAVCCPLTGNGAGCNPTGMGLVLLVT